MSLAPLLQASPAIQIHAAAAIAAFALGLVQFALPKGTTRHRVTGWLWVTLMVIVSVTAFFIHELRVWGPWSPIHLLAIFTLIMLPLAVLHARNHRVDQSQARHDQYFRRRAGHRGPVHIHAGPHHACDVFRAVTGAKTGIETPLK